MSNEVMKKDSGSLALFGDDAAKGFENMTQDDMALPFVRILGQLSPQVTDGDAKYIEGAKPGMIYNTVTSELYDGKKGIKVIPCYYKKDYPEWSDRGDGPGAPVAVHLPNSPVIATGKRDGSKIRLPNGNYVEKTAYFYVLAMVDGELKPAVVPMRSSNLSPARELNNLIKNLRFSDDQGSFNPASYSAVYKLNTVGKTAGSKSWHVYKPSRERNLDMSNKDDAAIFEIAAKLQEQVSKGTAKPKYDASQKKQDIV